MSTVGDNTTLLGDGTQFGGDHKDFAYKNGLIPNGSPGKQKPKNPDLFVESADSYTIKERPFFIPIDKGGVLVALEKLDRQLIEVITLPLCFQ